jgi:hypothetical protein
MSIIRFIGANDLDLNSIFLPEAITIFVNDPIYFLCMPQMGGRKGAKVIQPIGFKALSYLTDQTELMKGSIYSDSHGSMNWLDF